MLIVHRAERADALVAALAALLAETPADPFAAELVAVPTPGIERWLAQALSTQLGARTGEHDGVCANIEFPFPSALVAQVLALAGGIAPEHDPWQPQRLVWPLIEVVTAAIEEDWLDPLARHIREDRSLRYARLAHVAALYDRYARQRPELILGWAHGTDGGGWQPELWRRLRAAVGVPSTAERLQPACVAIRANPAQVALPPRLTLFGLTRLPSSHLQVLEALAEHRDVHLMLLHPSAAMWERGEARNRLLRSWGRDVHGLQRQLRTVLAAGTGEDRHHPLPAAPANDTLLHALQADVLTDQPSPAAPLRPGEAGTPAVHAATDPRLLLAPADRSISIHACHGRARQVEVLREAILHRLADDPTLEPRDVIVMCPDIEQFAPLIEAEFGERVVNDFEPDDGDAPAGVPGAAPPVLRVRLADRSLRRSTPMLTLAARLLELAAGRVTASEVLDLADTPPVRARFRFDDDELATVRDWVASAGIHWGLDASSRARFHLEEVQAGTWAAGLRRLLLGVAMDAEEHSLIDGVLPAAAIQSSEIELAGRFTEFYERLAAALAALAAPHTVPGWAATLTAAIDALADTAPREDWQRTQLDEILAELADDGGEQTELTLTEARSLLGERLEGRPTRANFRSGHLTFCTLMPMRSVPHRVICLLGLDDGAFPRHGTHDGDDLLLADPQPGDRDPRTEDRQLLLDALLAAGDALIITYSGNDERTNAPLPPAVPVGELLDAIDASARVAAGETAGEAAVTAAAGARASRRARAHVVVHHPLQPFDPRNFARADSQTLPSAPARAAGGPWSFSAAGLAGARVTLAPRLQPPPFLPEPLEPAPDAEIVTLDELVAFIVHPVRAFLRQRLGVSLFQDEDTIADALPVALDHLARWSVGDRLLGAVRAGTDPREACLAEIARGTLPPGALGLPVIQEVLPTVQLLAETAAAHALGVEARSEQTNVRFDDGTRLTGTVGDLHGHVLLSVTYSRLKAPQRLRTWVRFLALNAAHPEIPFEAVTIGRASGRGATIRSVRLPQLGASESTRREAALAQLEPLLAMRAEGLRRPLPVPCLSGHAYAHAQQEGDDPVAAANREWAPEFSRFPTEKDDPEHVLAVGPELDLEVLAQFAPRIWQPLLTREDVQER